MKYLCIRCNQEREREDFNQFDEQLETGICLYCTPPDIKMRSVERRILAGTPDQREQAQKLLDHYNKYSQSAERSKILKEKKDEVKKWNDPERLESYFIKKPEFTKLDYAEVKEIFWKFYKNIVQVQNVRIGSVGIEDTQKEQFENFVKWLIKDDAGAYDIYKSLIIFGKKGVGKSTLIEAGERTMNFLSDNTTYKNKYRVEEMDMIVHNLHTTGNLKPLERMKDGFLCIDEITEEHQTYKNFGNEIRLIEDILRVRHLAWKKKGQLTILTTNLSPKSFTDLFNSRTQDRIIQEYEVMEMQGEVNYRKVSA